MKYVRLSYIIHKMLDRFIPVVPSSPEELRPLIEPIQTVPPLHHSDTPFWLDLYDRFRSDYFLSTSAYRDFNPQSPLRHEHDSRLPYYWSHKLLLRAKISVKGNTRQLPYGSLVVSQQVSGEVNLDILPRTYVGIFPRRGEAEVYSHDRAGRVEDVALYGIFAHLNNLAKPLDTGYRQSALNFEKTIKEKKVALDTEGAKRIITEDFLNELPSDVIEFNETWEGYSGMRARGEYANEHMEAQCKDFFVAMDLLGIEGSTQAEREWAMNMYERGTEYVNDQDALTAARLGQIHADHSVVLETMLRNEGRLFDGSDYRTIETGYIQRY